MAKSKGILLAADSQSSSQLGDIGRFKGMDLLTPTEHEARLALRNREDGLVVLAERLRNQSCAGNVILKMGEEGILIQPGIETKNQMTDKIGALNTAPQDVAGAGDSLLITSALLSPVAAIFGRRLVWDRFLQPYGLGELGINRCVSKSS